MCTTDDDEIDFSSIKKNVQVVHERRKRVIQNIFAQKERSPSSSSRVGVCVLDFFFLFFFCSFSKALKHFLCVFFCLCSSSWHNNKIVVCTFASGSHSCRRRPFFGLLFFGPFFALCAFLCVLFVHSKTTKKRRPFPNQNSPSREESVAHHHHHHHHLVDALPFETPTKFSPKERRRGGVCGVCRTTTPPQKSDVGRARKRHARDISISTNSSDAFFFVVQSG